MFDLIQQLRRRRWANLAVVNLRLLLGFAFVPAGLKKVLDQPFTDPDNTGAFHEFLHAFHATGVFYQFVGVAQLTIACLLMTQTLAALGALLALPVFTAITVFCWSSGAGIVTCVMTSLMLAGTAGLALWDHQLWRGLVRPSAPPPAIAVDDDGDRPIDTALWQRCGIAILALYFTTCALAGGIYRPRGVELDNPAFYLLPLIAVFPVVTFVIEQTRRRRQQAGRNP